MGSSDHLARDSDWIWPRALLRKPSDQQRLCHASYSVYPNESSWNRYWTRVDQSPWLFHGTSIEGERTCHRQLRSNQNRPQQLSSLRPFRDGRGIEDGHEIWRRVPLHKLCSLQKQLIRTRWAAKRTYLPWWVLWRNLACPSARADLAAHLKLRQQRDSL